MSEILTVDEATPLIVHVASSQADVCPVSIEEEDPSGQSALFAVGDLDGDAEGEFVVANAGIVAICGGDGSIVTDIDGDGRAEILVGGNNPKLVVLDNAAGGWPVRGAEEWWPGMDHFPEDRAIDGSLPPGSATHWLGEGTNVWQGLPAGPPDLPDLGVEAEAYSEDCATTLVLAQVGELPCR